MKKNLKNYKRYNFTILEVLVALTIIAMISTFVCVKSSKLIKAYRFESALQRIKQEIDLTHQVATSYQIDIDFILEADSLGISCIRTTDERLQHLIPFFKKNLYFKNVRFKDATNFPLTIHFYGSGWVEPRSGFYITNQDRIAFVDLHQLVTPLITKQ